MSDFFFTILPLLQIFLFKFQLTVDDHLQSARHIAAVWKPKERKVQRYNVAYNYLTTETIMTVKDKNF